MKIKAIIFDKDGTLIDFDSFWVNVAVYAIDEMLKKLGADYVPTNEVLTALGVTDGVTAIDGIMCHGTYAQMAESIYAVLSAHGIDCTLDAVTTLTCDLFDKNASKGSIKPTCGDLRGVLTRLKSEGIRLAVVTTDIMSVTKKCLESLGISDCFDDIFTADGDIPAKPDPAAINRLCELYDLTPDEIIMVGDTLTDIKFANSGGIRAIGVASCAFNREILRKATDTVIDDVSCIFDVIGQ